MTNQEKDASYLWHPLTQHKTAKQPVLIERAKGALLYDDAGNEYIDGIASWYTCMYGHGNEYITKAMYDQMQALDFVMFSGFTHPPAITLAEKLMEILPANQQKIFFNDNGSTAVEAAIKMAFQYYHNQGDKRDTLIAFEDGFHGDTFGAMSASGLSSYNGPFEDLLLKVIRIPTPQKDTIDAVCSQLEAVLTENKCAAFIFEPLAQGAAGMKFHSAQGLDALLKLCKQHDVLTIADEIMTGFGKTGTDFAVDQLENKPDVMCLSKALTAGMFPLSITSCTQTIFDGFLSDEVHKGFFHAHTFSAHPVGCAAAIAGIELLQSTEIVARRKEIEEKHHAFAKAISSHPNASQVRVKGVIFALDLNVKMERYGNLRDELYQFFMQRGVALRPLGNTIYALPPYVITNNQLEKIYTVIEEALDNFN
ncbi:adenosylmethionine--8-amino-7-oxononanoate transaminase [Dokdonia sp. Hel_I_53]|uniref:adenosylmethionine--8-amino-7-oxononanoate transaminase n=1 Tax=Dokdonia sp. Hel_I_53 TaxID=1566287 RepID=UPI00119AC31E|nr:adenosylmethionine--8-amino-7-oxononanoate transaminase [Dokdonia sp. Hel_I_53]TVZ52428.1 adenosylmethionine-8-amino-7-oxononanoate aminotransferase [Dokdonia sp. Hel_I_53]